MPLHAGVLAWRRNLVAVALSATSFAAHAWGVDGHRLVADLAESRLSPAARTEAQRLLGLEPGATLASVSTWADEVRDPATAGWHYLNFPRGGNCSYDADRQCVAGNCVVDALDRQVAVLRSNAPDEQRLKALKYVVHFVGDVHQPLHAGFGDDRGGNQWQLQAWGRGTNLHSAWDTGLLLNAPGGVAAVRASVAAFPVSTAQAGPFAPVAWAEESCRVVANAEFYPAGHELPEGYAARWQPVVAQRLGLAAQRLANVLNGALAPH